MRDQVSSLRGLVGRRGWGYALAVAGTAGGAALRWGLGLAVGELPPYITFYPIVMLSAVVGGAGPGALATILGALAATLLFIGSRGELAISSAADAVGMALFVIIGLAISFVGGRLRVAREQAGAQTRRAEAAASELASVAQFAAEGRRRLEAILESAMDAIITVDEQQRIVLFNPAAERMFRCPAAEALGSSLDRFIPPRYRDVHREHVRRFGQTGQTPRAMGHLRPLSALRDGGEEFPIEASISQVQVGGHKLFSVIVRDITDRVRAQEKLRLVVESAPNALVMANAEGRIVLVNAQTEKLFGYQREELIGQPVEVLVPQRFRARHPQFRHGFMADPQVRPMGAGRDLFGLRKDGSEVPVEIGLNPIQTEEGALVLASIVDITERKQAEAALHAAKEAAEQANRAKDRFLAVLSHELRTPLSAVLPALGMLEPLVNPEARELVETARRNVEMEARLIDDLLDATRIARGKVELNKALVALCTVLQRAAEVCTPDIEARQLHFRLHVDGGPHVIEADAARLQQVFWNLIKNAVKFTPAGGCVGVRAYRGDGHAIVEVSDSGMGIEPQSLSRIFAAFEQGDRGVTRQFGGLGLGLAISKTLVDLHGGSIRAHSPGQGRGATFTVELPVVSQRLPELTALAARESAAARSSKHPVGGAAQQQRSAPLRILLVEDHGDTARILRRLLKGQGHDVQHAADVATALRLGGEHPFDLIISDLGLPDGSGHDLLRQLRADGRAVPAIALSGYGQEQDIQQSQEAGFATHLTKPVDLRQLGAAIQQAVAGADHPDQA